LKLYCKSLQWSPGKWLKCHSGTLTGDLETRHRLKAEQLLDNPFGVDGYVVVVDFSARRVIFSFHQYEESNA